MKPGYEVVMECGCEGGGATIYRSVQVTLFDPEFHMEGSTIYLDENDEENWRSWSRPSVPSLEEAIGTITGDDSWVMFYAIKVHPKYREAIWRLVQEASARLRETRPDRMNPRSWSSAERSWRSACGMEETA